MSNKMSRFAKKSFSVVLAAAIGMSGLSFHVNAQTNVVTDPFIVVSLGDSYSSGEGIEAFYGQEKAIADKVVDQDWLAHRSRKGWPTLLQIPGLQGKMSDYKVGDTPASAACQWYFKASSGAESKHFNRETQEKIVRKKGVYNHKEHKEYLPKQLDIFSQISGTVDYVTLSIGGNDVGFADIITTCATGSTYLGSKKLEKQMDAIWASFDQTEMQIRQVYQDIQTAAGPQAAIVVAGYPKLLDKEGKGFLISKKEATIVNENVTKFNDRLEAIVNQCRSEGMNIYFVDVEAEFDKDGGHQAYSSNAWINSIDLLANAEDLDDRLIASAYSIHPNEQGAQAYARCMNSALQTIENDRQVAMLAAENELMSLDAFLMEENDTLLENVLMAVDAETETDKINDLIDEEAAQINEEVLEEAEETAVNVIEETTVSAGDALAE